MARKTHVPGPWKFHKKAGPLGDQAVYAECERGFDLAIVQNGGIDAQTIANARLIASAPELLESLTYLVNALELPSCVGPRGVLIDVPKAIARAREVIAVARGEEAMAR